MEDARGGSCKRSHEEGTPDQKGDDFDEKELERLAVKSLILEAKRRKVRAEEAGPSGWTKRPVLRPNKRFFNSVVAGSIATNRRKEQQQQQQHKQQLSQECPRDGSIVSNSREWEKRSTGSTERKSSSTRERKESYACKQDRSRPDDSADLKE